VEGTHDERGRAPESEGFVWRGRRRIPWSELTFRQDAAGGPGGQHANRSATRVSLIWRPLASSALSEEEKERVRAALAPRLTSTGILQLRNGDERSARRNRERCLEQLGQLLRDALTPRRRRKPTRPTRASREKRLESKRQRSRKKEGRRPPGRDD
jgi:ribosome-associated protein